jgi:hypothetical protein
LILPSSNIPRYTVNQVAMKELLRGWILTSQPTQEKNRTGRDEKLYLTAYISL